MIECTEKERIKDRTLTTRKAATAITKTVLAEYGGEKSPPHRGVPSKQQGTIAITTTSLVINRQFSPSRLPFGDS